MVLKMNRHIDIIKKEFTKQAPAFSKYQKTSEKEAFNMRAVGHMHLTGKENVLEIAAGTCAFGRTIAPHVSKITELDATEAMLSVGKAENEKCGITNAEYIIGEAEALPFPDKTFDTVVSRLAFHHFENPELVYREMCRVIKPGGLLVTADMLARPEPFRASADRFEKLRDASHVRCISKEEFLGLARSNGMLTELEEVCIIHMKLNEWMKLTKVPDETKARITSAMKSEISGGEKTGFSPYINNEEICFDHIWLLLINRKPY